MVKGLVRNYLINIFALWMAASYLGSFHLADGLKSLLLVGLGFTLLHLILEPIFALILGSINFLTMGVLGLGVDSVALFLLTRYFPQVTISSWSFQGASISGFVIHAFEFTIITGTILSALVINIIRRVLTVLVD